MSQRDRQNRYEPLGMSWEVVSDLHGAEPLIENERDGTLLLLVPGGRFLAGEGKVAIELRAYYLAIHPVTNAQYARFLTARRPEKDELDRWLWVDSLCFVRKNGSHFESYGGKDEHPVVCVSWHGAEAYCEWAGLRLPSELEWEKGGRGVDGRGFPWGDAWDKAKCQHSKTGVSETTCGVWEYPDGCSYWGHYQMSGNVCEWSADWYDEQAYKRYQQGDLAPPTNGERRVLRGGSWGNTADQLRCEHRNPSPPGDQSECVGFRAARNLTVP